MAHTGRVRAAAVFERDSPEFGRALSFIDAIFGFSITLLITNLQMPTNDQFASLSALLGSPIADQLVGFLISFVVIAGFWRSNHRALAEFRAVDPVTIGTGIVIAGLVIFIPFTTQGISGGPAAELPLPTALYAVNVALVVLATVALSVLGQVRGLRAEPLSWPTLAHQLATAVVFLVSVPIAYRLGADAAKYSWLALLVVSPAAQAVTERVVAHRGG